MKKLICLLFAITLLIPSGLFADTSNSAPMNMNLDNAIKMIELNNMDIKLLNQRIDISKKKYEKDLEESDKAKSKYSDNSYANLNLRKIESLNWKISQLDLETLLNDKKEKISQLKADIKKQYFNMLLLQSDMQNIDLDLALLDKKLTEVNIKIKRGQAKESDNKNLMAQKLLLQNQKNSLNNQINIAAINFKKNLGVSLSQSIKLENITMPYSRVDNEKLIENIGKSVENNYKVRRLYKQVELKELEKELVKNHTDYKYSTTVDNLDKEIADLKFKIEYEKQNVESDLWIDYYNITLLDDNIKLEQANLDLEKLNYDSVTTKAKLGILDAATEMSARSSYNKQKNTLQRAMYEFVIEVEQFNSQLNIE